MTEEKKIVACSFCRSVIETPRDLGCVVGDFRDGDLIDPEYCCMSCARLIGAKSSTEH